MTRQKLLLGAVLSLAPLALIAATNPPAGPAPGPEDGWLRHLDTNGDGVISKEEAQAAANARIDKAFARLDTNQDGQITQDEIRAAQEARRAEREARFEARIKQADTNGDGLLSKEEAQAGMPMLARGFDRLDTNKDGQLSLDEIKAGRAAMAGRRHGPHGWRGFPPPEGPQPDATPEAPSMR